MAEPRNRASNEAISSNTTTTIGATDTCDDRANGKQKQDHPQLTDSDSDAEHGLEIGPVQRSPRRQQLPSPAPTEPFPVAGVEIIKGDCAVVDVDYEEGTAAAASRDRVLRYESSSGTPFTSGDESTRETDADADGRRPGSGPKPRTTATTTTASSGASNGTINVIRSRRQSSTTRREGGRKLSASQMQALTSAPGSLPIAVVQASAPTINNSGNSAVQLKPGGGEYPASAGAVVQMGSRVSSMAELMLAQTHSQGQSQNQNRNQNHNQNGMQQGIGTEPVMSNNDNDNENNKNNMMMIMNHSNTNDTINSNDGGQRRLPPRTIVGDGWPTRSSRTLSTPPTNRRTSINTSSLAVPHIVRRNSFNPIARPPPLNLSQGNLSFPVPSTTPSTAPPKPQDRSQADESDNHHADQSAPSSPTSSIVPPPLPPIPLPPMSLHTHLQLELAGARPSPLYIYRHHSSDTPYESSAMRVERLINFLFLPAYLEFCLTFGALVCLDAFLYTFTLLPMRFCIAASVLIKWWSYVLWKEIKWLVSFVRVGIWRLWSRGRVSSRSKPNNGQRDRDRSQSRVRDGANTGGYASDATVASYTATESFKLGVGSGTRNQSNNMPPPPRKHPTPRTNPMGFRHRRTKSMPSNLTSYNKADLLQGAVIICSSLALMTIDASRMYHFIRAQSAVKLYVILNLLEVGDRLLAALGQDILECLFSNETLSRNSLGRSKVLLPFGMFLLSLVYNVVHAVCLFYQVITLNVAVNSYSNALLSLIMSNQFVEIKGSVFKKIEKENLFQLTCADVVERFQLWVILIIIAMRNIVEVGGLSVPSAGGGDGGGGSWFGSGGFSGGDAGGGRGGPGPLHTASNMPASFTLLPSWILSGEVLSPFLVVIGSEMLVDWIKHAYINKFNNVKPGIYGRMLDIFCKDYYTNAFGAPTLTRRVGLPLLPLSCLFIRATVQIYNMFLATHLSAPPLHPPTSTTSLSLESASSGASSSSSPAIVAAMEHFDTLIRNALGRAVYGDPAAASHARSSSSSSSFFSLSFTFNMDDAIAAITMLVVFFLAWLVLLVVKLLLGMVLLKYSRDRYAKLLQQQARNEKREGVCQPGRRVGGWGHVELGDERRKVIYQDDGKGLERMRERERKMEETVRRSQEGVGADCDALEGVVRYEMLAKRIW